MKIDNNKTRYKNEWKMIKHARNCNEQVYDAERICNDTTNIMMDFK